MGTANDKSYDATHDTTHDNLEDDTHQDIHQVSHQDSTPSAVILRLIPHFQFVQKRILRKRGKYLLTFLSFSRIIRKNKKGSVADANIQEPKYRIQTRIRP